MADTSPDPTAGHDDTLPSSRCFPVALTSTPAVPRGRVGAADSDDSSGSGSGSGGLGDDGGMEQCFEDALEEIDFELNRSSPLSPSPTPRAHRDEELRTRIKRIIEENRVSLQNSKLVKDSTSRWSAKLKDANFMQTVDKMSFAAGVLNVLVTEFILLQYPHLLHVWYTLLVFPLLTLRFLMYHKAKWHYFMIDFCYFVQLILLFYLYFYPHSAALFQLVFALANGPLAWGAITWGNALVFHDLDKLTSVFIHFYPCIVTFCIRWYPQMPSAGFRSVHCSDGTQECSAPLRGLFLYPLYGYVFWQVCYYLKTERVDRDKLRNDEDLWTSVRWLSERRPNSVLLAACRSWWGRHLRPVTVFMVLQFIYTLLTMLPMPLIFHFYWVHVAWLAIVFGFCLWYGAKYYFEIFAQRRNEAKAESRNKQRAAKAAAVAAAAAAVAAAANGSTAGDGGGGDGGGGAAGVEARGATATTA